MNRTFLMEMRQAMADALHADERVLVLGQLVKYGLGGLTEGLHDLRPKQVITYPVCENLMNGSAMGLSLAGMIPIVIHERMDFLAVGMDPLVNHIPVWPKRQPMKLPLVILCVIGKGNGQGPQHSKNLSHWFKNFEGWNYAEPSSPFEAYDKLIEAVQGDKPTMYVAHREFFARTETVTLPNPVGVGLCGASARHEAQFYAPLVAGEE